MRWGPFSGNRSVLRPIPGWRAFSLRNRLAGPSARLGGFSGARHPPGPQSKISVYVQSSFAAGSVPCGSAITVLRGVSNGKPYCVATFAVAALFPFGAAVSHVQARLGGPSRGAAPRCMWLTIGILSQRGPSFRCRFRSMESSHHCSEGSV